MPYADIEDQRKYAREAYHRRKAERGEPYLEKLRARAARYRGKNREAIAAKARARYAADPDKFAQRSCDFRNKHKSRLDAQKETTEWKVRREKVLAKHRKKFAVERRDWTILNKFGITGEEYRSRLAAQPKCAICQTKLIDPVLDHCHKTRKVREFLCRKHNAAIGLLNDNPELLLSAYEYLMKHKTD